MGRTHDNDHSIRVAIDMFQFTERDGKVWPIAFDWREPNGDVSRVNIDKIISCIPCAEQMSGAVGDRYECEINGQLEYLYYSILTPRKWFKVVQVSREEYESYYKLKEGA